MEWLVRYGLSESPTTATVREPASRSRISSVLGFSCIAPPSRRLSGPDVNRSRRAAERTRAPCPWSAYPGYRRSPLVAWARMRGALATNPSDLAAQAAEVLRRNDMGGWTRAAPNLYPHQW